MKHAFRLSRVGAVAAVALAVLYSAIILAGAQANVASTPAPFVVQLTSSTIPPTPPATPTPTPSPTPSPSPGASPAPTPTPVPRNTTAADIDGSGRFVVIESSGDIATERTPHVRNAQGQIVTRGRNNEDGNPEIFLLDYAQRRIFQITDTTHALKDTTLSPVEPSNIDVEIVNLRPQLSKDGRHLVFISNAYVDGTGLSPKQFVGQQNVAGLRLDANTEIFLYEMPVPPPVDLTAGAEVAFADMASGNMRRITNTPASRVPTAGTATTPPFFARDNDAPAVSDDTQVDPSTRGLVIAFHSRARGGNVGAGNPDGNAEIFLFEDTNLDADGQTFVQATDTEDVPVAGQPLPRLVFNNNPSLSGDGTRLAFMSNADEQLGAGVLPGAEAEAGRGNGEVYVATYAGGASALSNVRRVTTTAPSLTGGAINTLSAGKRMSHDGTLLAFESFAVFNASGGVTETSQIAVGIYVYDIPANGYTEVVQRPATATETQDIGLRWPTFTGDNSRVVWSSILNLRPDGTVAGGNDTAGLNPAVTIGGVLRRPTQIFSAPARGPRQVSRLTRLRGNFEPIQPFPSNTVERLTFSSTGELGGGNSDGSFEAFYLRIPRPDVAASASPTPAAVSFFTGASDRPVVAATPAPSPSPGVPVVNLAPGMLGIARSELVIGAGPREVATGDAHETLRRPPLPVELANVSVSVDGAAAGLYSVAPNQINFVVPPGLTPSTTALPVVIHNNGALINAVLVVNQAQPDIFTSTNGAGGRAAALNVTNPCVSPPGEPFPDRTSRPVGSASGNCSSADSEVVPTQLLFMLTGVRNVPRASVTARIGTVDIPNANIVSVGPSLTPGFDQVVIRLPDNFDAFGDVPVIITVNLNGVNFISRPADTAPRITVFDTTP